MPHCSSCSSSARNSDQTRAGCTRWLGGAGRSGTRHGVELRRASMTRHVQIRCERKDMGRIVGIPDLEPREPCEPCANALECEAQTGNGLVIVGSLERPSTPQHLLDVGQRTSTPAPHVQATEHQRSKGPDTRRTPWPCSHDRFTRCGATYDNPLPHPPTIRASRMAIVSLIVCIMHECAMTCSRNSRHYARRIRPPRAPRLPLLDGESGARGSRSRELIYLAGNAGIARRSRSARSHLLQATEPRTC